MRKAAAYSATPVGAAGDTGTSAHYLALARTLFSLAPPAYLGWEIPAVTQEGHTLVMKR